MRLGATVGVVAISVIASCRRQVRADWHGGDASIALSDGSRFSCSDLQHSKYCPTDADWGKPCAVDLDNRGLTRVPELARLDCAHDIKDLHLNNNQISNLRPGAFDALTALEEIELWGNPWSPALGIANEYCRTKAECQRMLQMLPYHGSGNKANEF